MKTICAFILLRMVRAFQSWPSYISEGDKKDFSETQLLTMSETSDGHCVLISFKNEPYLITIRPVKSEIKIEGKTAEEMFPPINMVTLANRICGMN
jgi:hypothetical protein